MHFAFGVSQTVRPIFWSNRPKAYVRRTLDWDTFPSGRWGNARSPAYGTLSDYQFMRRHTSSAKRKEKAIAAWGAELKAVEDVVNVFVGKMMCCHMLHGHTQLCPLYANGHSWV